MVWDLRHNSSPPGPSTGMSVPSSPVATSKTSVGGTDPWRNGRVRSVVTLVLLFLQRRQPPTNSDQRELENKSHSTLTDHRHQSPSLPPTGSRAQVTPSQRPQFQYSKCTGRKKALCIGINYNGQRSELRGCVNDAKHFRDFLIRKNGYKSCDIVLLTDDSFNPRQQPTRQNIIDAMHWLVRGARPHDSFFFHYSGHGEQAPNLNGDHVDDLSQVILPFDYKKRGHITNHEMHSIMVKSLPSGCRLTAIFDSCHSGTMLNLPYIYSPHGRLRGTHPSDRHRNRRKSPADVISFSGCENEQASADIFQSGVYVGAMSYAFIASFSMDPTQSYQELLKSVRQILYPKFNQQPQLSSSHIIDTRLRFMA